MLTLFRTAYFVQHTSYNKLRLQTRYLTYLPKPWNLEYPTHSCFSPERAERAERAENNPPFPSSRSAPIPELAISLKDRPVFTCCVLIRPPCRIRTCRENSFAPVDPNERVCNNKITLNTLYSTRAHLDEIRVSNYPTTLDYTTTTAHGLAMITHSHDEHGNDMSQS